MGGKLWTTKENAQFIQWWKEGIGVEEIAKRLNRTVRTCYIRRYDLKLPTRIGRKRVRNPMGVKKLTLDQIELRKTLARMIKQEWGEKYIPADEFGRQLEMRYKQYYPT